MRLALIGKSLIHSFSKSYFEDKFKRFNIQDASYDNLEFENAGQLRSAFQELKPFYQGLNITIPYKEEITSLLDEMDSEALKIGSVNCVAIVERKTKGYNTDYLGFIDSVRSELEGYQRAYILGTGGASKAINHAFLQYLNIPTMLITSGKVGLNYEEFKEKGILEHSVIVNTTPLGMYPHVNACPDLDYRQINGTHLCVDLIYNPSETLFMKKCLLQGAKVKNGKDMLVAQAEWRWKIWNGTQ